VVEAQHPGCWLEDETLTFDAYALFKGKAKHVVVDLPGNGR
jgi:hypothetical protein